MKESPSFFASLMAVLLLPQVSGFAPLNFPQACARTRGGRHTAASSTQRQASNADDLIPLKRGSTVAVITPMHPDTGKVDYEGLELLLNYHVESGTSNLCILGTTGEASVLSQDERDKVLKLAVETVKGQLPILAGTGSIDPVKVRELTLHAKDVGCDAALVVTPPYVKPPQRGLISLMTTTADLGLPVVIYNVPGRTGVDMTDESIAICAQHENIVAVKDATGKLERLVNLKKLLGDNKDFLCYSGDDLTSVDFLLQGGDGCISVVANVAAQQMADMVEAALKGDDALARELNEPLIGLHKNLFCEANPIPVKWAAHRIGLINSCFLRPPLDTMDPEKAPLVEAALRRANLLD